MLTVLRIFFDWSEVWALFIPLAFLFYYKPKSNWIAPIKFYIIIALLLNISIDFIWYVNKYEWFNSRPGHVWNNNVLYVLHSAARFFLYSAFFAKLGKEFNPLTKIFSAFFILPIILYFIFPKKILFSYYMAVEVGLLLIYCLLYTYKFIKSDNTASSVPGSILWIVGSLTLYTAVNFFLFLFYQYLVTQSRVYSVEVWDIHNILFILLCVGIAIAFKNDNTKK